MLTSSKERGPTSRLILALLGVLLVAGLFTGGACADSTAIFSDNFEEGFSKSWTVTGDAPDWYTKTPKNGTHGLQFHGAGGSGAADEQIAQTISTEGYQNITVSCYLGGKSLDAANEYLLFEWFNGSRWTELTRVQGVIGKTATWNPYVSATLPAAANNNPNFQLRLSFYADSGNDYAYADDILVTGTPATATLSLNGDGSGSVLVNGIERMLPWSGNFTLGDAVSLEAVSASGWEFASWSGDASGSSNPVTVVMSGDQTVAVNFNQLSYTLSLEGSGNGSVLVDGTPHALPWSGSFLSSSEVTLQAVPASGWNFGGWSGDVTWPGSTVIVTIDGNKDVTATFEQINYTLAITGAGSGTILVDGISHSLPYSGSFLSGTYVSLEAVPAEEWRFNGWAGDINWQGREVSVEMDENKSLTATFDDLSRTLTIAKTGEGTVLVDGATHDLPWSGSFLEGAEVTLEAVSSAGWEFSAWSGDINWPGRAVTLTMNGNKSLTATFTERSEFNLTLTQTGTGLVRLNGEEVTLPWSGVLERGASITLEAVPGEHWQFDGWSGDITGASNPVSFTMLDDYEVSAVFSRIPYQLDVTSEGSGSVEVNGEAHELPWSGTVYAGDEVTLEALAATGWRFQQWSGDVTGTENPETLVIAGDTSVTAVFFQPDEFLLTVRASGSGSVLINGVAPELPWTGAFPNGAEVILEAVASGTGEFQEWTGDLSGTTNPQTIIMESDKDLTATFLCVQTPFSDVACDHWAARAITAAKEAGIVYGYPDGTYRPSLKVERSAMAVYVARAMVGGESALPEPPSEPTFPDVAPDHWAYAAIEYTASQQVVEGFPDGLFYPGWTVTRGQMAVFVARAIVEPAGEAGLEGYQPPATPTFPDVPTTMWCYPHVEYLVEQDIVHGYGEGAYRPEAPVTRDQMAVYITRAFGIIDD